MSDNSVSSFVDNYQQKIANSIVDNDEEQLKVVQSIQAVINELEQQQQGFSFPQLFSRVESEKQSCGIYLWGGVGRGKTFLMDLLFKSIHLPNKLRIHFHRFMHLIHEKKRDLGETEQPIAHIVGEFAQQYQLICLDEMFVHDIADAMLIAEILKQLQQQKIFLFITSNFHPDQLYQDGLQRARFIPAIEHLKSQMQLIELKGNVDYRQQQMQNIPVFLDANDANTINQMEMFFSQLVPFPFHAGEQFIELNARKISVIKWDAGVLWLNFEELCNSYRDTSDYELMAKWFHTIMVSDLYLLDGDKRDIVRRWINFIDVCYNRHVNILLSSSVPQSEIYQGNALSFEFQRTQSRLQEMQTLAYLQKNRIFSKILDYNEISEQQNKKSQLSHDDPVRFGDWVCRNGRCSDF